jgi:hypothetical protein
MHMADMLRSAQCLKSIYEATTFIFTDLNTIQAWFGFCLLRPEWEMVFKSHNTPPAFRKYARNFELSLKPDFGRSLICGNTITDLNRHDSYDFHWLCLPKFSSLRTVKIWVDAQSKDRRFEPEEIVFDIKKLDVKAFAKSLSSFGNIESLTISTPLGPCFDPENGLVRNFAVPNVTLYRRESVTNFLHG